LRGSGVFQYLEHHLKAARGSTRRVPAGGRKKHLMKINFWILKLNILTLLRVLKGKKRSERIVLTYIESTRPAAVLLKLIMQRSGSWLNVRKIGNRPGQAGPLMNLAFVRNDKNEVITIPIYHHILGIRRKILAQLVESFKAFDFFKGKNPLSMLAAYLGMEIAGDITPAVYMAHYARWKDYEPGSEKTENILVLPGSYWNDELTEGFKEYVDRVVFQKKEKWLKLPVKVFLHLIRALLTICIPVKSEAVPDPRQPGKILTIYRMGLLKDERNDIPFFHASSIHPQNMLILLRHAHHLPTEAEMEWMKQTGVQCISSPDESTSVPGVLNWKPSGGFKAERRDFYRVYLKTALQAFFQSKKNTLWLLERLRDIGLNRAFWKDFFTANNVRIIVNSAPAGENFMLNLSISETGGIGAAVERSILFDYCTIIHNPPNHISFITGPYSMTQIPEPTFSHYTVQSGGLNVNHTANGTGFEGIRELKRHAEIVIAVFDEVPNDWFFGDSIAEMYRALANLARDDRRFSLLIKTKKPQVLERLEDVYREIQELSRDGRCLIASYKITVSAAAAYSDLVVCAPSTAAFESVLTGTRTIVYNPMRSGSRLFYTQQGLNRRVFEDSPSMIAAVKQFADGKNDSVGECSDLVRQIDPFSDGRGAERIGDYLNACLQGFQQGLDRETILKNTNREYASRWGADKIVTESAHEVIQ
jgi:hypothetical protein